MHREVELWPYLNYVRNCSGEGAKRALCYLLCLKDQPQALRERPLNPYLKRGAAQVSKSVGSCGHSQPTSKVTRSVTVWISLALLQAITSGSWRSSLWVQDTTLRVNQLVQEAPQKEDSWGPHPYTSLHHVVCVHSGFPSIFRVARDISRTWHGHFHLGDREKFQKLN